MTTAERNQTVGGEWQGDATPQRSGEYQFFQSISDFVAVESAENEAPETPTGLRASRALPDNETMETPITRPELDAKLETIEARMDGRLARIEDRFASIDRQFSDIRAILAEQKNTAWKAAGAVIATFVAVFAIYVAAFDSGRDTAQVAAQAQQETAAALTQIRQIVSDLKAAQPPAAPATPPSPK